ncbi:MAG TPA: HEAT repeat domain-containing protein [Vicinamibacterales bacterium]|nr:HEAT repeat domain-containing protein [Vicinamibacterales bacterium]
MPSTTPTTEPMSAERSGLLAEFARACKAAARAVSLYPGAHPAIGGSLSRLVSAAGRLTSDGRIVCSVHPDMLAIEGEAPVRPDPAIGELAALLHERLIGALTIQREADAEDWRALLLLLARAPEDLLARGGIGSAWAGSGRAHFEIREIDYAEVLRERAGGEKAQWDRIIALCLHGDTKGLDERALGSLVECLSDSQRFGDLLEHLQKSESVETVSVSMRLAALLQLMRTALEAAKARNPLASEQALQTMADSCARLTPEMILAMLGSRQSSNAADAQMANDLMQRMSDHTVASFVARSVTGEKGATERLAHALEVLVPEAERKGRVLELAHDEARQSEAGQEEGFERLWQSAADMLTSYSDASFVSDEYGKELTAARAQALEVERVSDDPPERVHAWVATVSEPALQDLDLNLLRDLLRIEDDPALWERMASVVIGEIERRVIIGDAPGAVTLAEALVQDTAADGRPELRAVATRSVERLAAGPLVKHVGAHLRKVEDIEVEFLNRLCRAIGAGVVTPLAELLAVEENPKSTRRLRELLLGFGAAGRQSVEKLKNSPNPAVRRTAVDLLRAFGGQEALPELVSMLNDADPQVQRESIRAIVQIGTNNAYAVLQRALVSKSATRETVLDELLGLRDDKAAPLLCYVLKQTQPTGRFLTVHLEMIDALGSLRAHPESIRTLKQLLYGGSMWTPLKTAALRRAAASALKHIGSDEAAAVLDEAIATGSRGVRKAAKAQVGTVLRPETKKTT